MDGVQGELPDPGDPARDPQRQAQEHCHSIASDTLSLNNDFKFFLILTFSLVILYRSLPITS